MSMLEQTKELLNNIGNCNIKTIKNHELFTTDNNIVKSLEFLCSKTSTLPKRLDEIIFNNLKELEVYQLVYLTRYLSLFANILLRKNPWKLKKATKKLLQRCVLLHTYHCYCYSALLVYKNKSELKDIKIVSDFNITHLDSVDKMIDTFKFDEINMYFLYNSIDILSSTDKTVKSYINKIVTEIEDNNEDDEEVMKMTKFIREQKELK